MSRGSKRSSASAFPILYQNATPVFIDCDPATWQIDPKLVERVQRKRAIAAAYAVAVADLQGVELMPEAAYGRCSRWLSCVTIDPHGATTTSVRVHAALVQLAIELRFPWRPLHRQAPFAASVAVGGGQAQALATNALALPSGLGLTPDQLEIVTAALRSTLV